MRLITFLAVCIAAVAAAPPASNFQSQRIVGGSATTIDQWPEMVVILQTADGFSFGLACGGSILNNRSILTAAHCFLRPANQYRLRIGSSFISSGGVVHNVGSIISHPSYNRWTMDNDIGIMRSATTFSLNNQARAASIAGSNYNLGDNQVVWATGWGALWYRGPISEQLRQVQIWTVNQNVCAQRYATRRTTITANMLCSGWLDVGGRDQCQGDSGGPLFHNRVVVGVCSFGHECALAFFPGVNARVSRYTSWIQSNA